MIFFCKWLFSGTGGQERNLQFHQNLFSQRLTIHVLGNGGITVFQIPFYYVSSLDKGTLYFLVTIIDIIMINDVPNSCLVRMQRHPMLRENIPAHFVLEHD